MPPTIVHVRGQDLNPSPRLLPGLSCRPLCAEGAGGSGFLLVWVLDGMACQWPLHQPLCCGNACICIAKILLCRSCWERHRQPQIPPLRNTQPHPQPQHPPHASRKLPPPGSERQGAIPAVLSLISKKPAGTVQSPRCGSMPRRHSRSLPSCSTMQPTTWASKGAASGSVAWRGQCMWSFNITAAGAINKPVGACSWLLQSLATHECPTSLRLTATSPARNCYWLHPHPPSLGFGSLCTRSCCWYRCGATGCRLQQWT